MLVAGGGDLVATFRDSPALRSTVFEPLVTTKASGTGLGLALVKSVTERHGGRVSAGNHAAGGAEVKLYLPDAAREPLTTAAQDLPPVVAPELP